MHAPTLPSLPSWETPIAASREIVEAIVDVADSAVDAATNAVRSARGRRRSTPVVVWVAVAAALVGVAALARARRHRGDGAVRTPTTVDAWLSTEESEKVDGSAVPTTASARTERPVGAGTASGRSSNAD